MPTFKGYYLPPNIEEELSPSMDFEERLVGDATILVPILTPDHVHTLLPLLRSNRQRISGFSITKIASLYDKVSTRWQDHNYDRKQVALKYLPILTSLSPELIEYFQFRSIYKISQSTIEFLASFYTTGEVFKRFVEIKGSNTYLRSYGGLRDKMKIKNVLRGPKEHNLVTYITPSNVPGFIEALGIFLGNIAKASVLVKTPTAQPLFAPLFAESIREVSPELGDTLCVVPWSGGDRSIEDMIFEQSDVVSVVSSTETALSVKQRVDQFNKRKNGGRIQGCYHGGKFGMELVAREFATEEVAGLAAIDAVGYEGYMCASPAFGFFVERGGELSPEEFAAKVAEKLRELSLIIPQQALFRSLRERKVAETIPNLQLGQDKVFTTPNHDYAVVYQNQPSLNPVGQNRFVRVMPVDDLAEVVQMTKPWRGYLQTAGVAIPNNRLFEGGLAEAMGKAGFSSLRVVGTVALPRLGEAWDRNFPFLEFFIPDSTDWISVNTTDVAAEIKQLSQERQTLFEGGVFALEN